tara:strand:- start:16 stop:474 length:459 start_codon:yes stop_codon:yes gene_type:complete
LNLRATCDVVLFANLYDQRIGNLYKGHRLLFVYLHTIHLQVWKVDDRLHGLGSKNNLEYRNSATSSIGQGRPNCHHLTVLGLLVVQTQRLEGVLQDHMLSVQVITQKDLGFVGQAQSLLGYAHGDLLRTLILRDQFLFGVRHTQPGVRFLGQ